MGLLDSVLGQVLGGAPQEGAPDGVAGGAGLAGVLGGLLGNDGEHGGLGGLVSKFQQAGMGEVIHSWIGNGENQPVSGDQLRGALGNDAISGMASKLGINASMLLPLLTTMLPTIINQLTPHGKVPEQGLGNQQDLMSSLGNLLGRR